MGAVKYVSQVGAVAVALGVGGLLTGHGAVAAADEGTGSGPKTTTSQASGGSGQASSNRTRAVGKPRQKAAAAVRSSGPAAPAAAASAPAMRAASIVQRRVTVAHFAVQRPPDPNVPVAPVGDLFAALSQVVRRQDASTGSAATAVVLASPQSPNLLVNGDAEVGDPSATGYFAATVPGWQLSGTPTVIEYGTQRRFPWPLATPGPLLPAFLAFPSTSPDPANNKQFFGGGPVATSTLTQTVSFNGHNVDNLSYNLSGDLGGFTIDPSSTKVTVNFLDSGGNSLGTGSLSQVSAIDRLFQTKFIHRTVTGTVPVGTVSAQVTVTFTDRNPVLGNYNNAYADNLSLTVADPTLPAPTPTPPPSNVGHLDHVYVIYMENKGYTDIVGSPNAPYFNLLINAYGLASNYYALTHPSDQNYTAAIGGNDFGVNWNCPQDCFDKKNIPDSIEASPNNLTWAGYAENGQGYNLTDPAVLPYLAFQNIYNDPFRVQTHIFNLDQLEQDLNGPNPANFVWVAADDETNMEGPTSGLGVVPWAISQILPPALGGHQYNVAAGDVWLQDTIGVIFNSASWQDPNQRSAIFLTFDEDYNNLSTGNGNQGNHVVTVVIPSPGAVGTTAGTMKGGGFIVDDHYNHYSLMRTVEEALGLPPLTNNDKYAVPMNGFWNA